MYSICTLANKNALHDLKVFLFTLNYWNKEEKPNLYVYCDSTIETFLKTQTYYKGKIFIKNALEAYTNYDRKMMEALPGKEFPTLFGDFVCEKMNLMNWVFETEQSMLFCDADICFLGKLPVIDTTKKLILSRHMIREYDEKRFGIYNAGFLFVGDKTIPDKWKIYTKSSSFFEQKSMEDLALEFKDSLDEFPVQNNFGWWRLFQGKESVETLKSKWSLRIGTMESSNIHVEGKPLLSIHTHFRTNDYVTNEFNKFVLNYLSKFSKMKLFVNFLKTF